MSTLIEQMLAELQLKGLTPKTQKIYLREVSNYAKYFGKSPEELLPKPVVADKPAAKPAQKTRPARKK